MRAPAKSRGIQDRGVLAAVFQYLGEGEVLQARRVSAAWEAAAGSEEYWGMKCRRDGLGRIRPQGGVGYEGFYKQFAGMTPGGGSAEGGEGGGCVEWLLKYDAVQRRWEANEDLLDSLRRCPLHGGGGSSRRSPMTVVAAMPGSDRAAPLQNCARFLNSCLRAGDGGFLTPEVRRRQEEMDEHAAPLGIQVWSQPALLHSGGTALFMLVRGAASKAGDEEAASAPALFLQSFVYSMASSVLVFEDAAPRWWEPCFPGSPDGLPSRLQRLGRMLRAPRPLPTADGDEGEADQGIDRTATARAFLSRMEGSATPAKAARLHVVSCGGEADALTLPGFEAPAAGAAGDAAFVAQVAAASWLSHFEEVLFWNPGMKAGSGGTPPPGADGGVSWSERLAEDIFGVGLEGEASDCWGKKASPLHLGGMWETLSLLTVGLADYADVVGLCVARANKVAEEVEAAAASSLELSASAQERAGGAILTEEFGDELATKLLQGEVEDAESFYRNALLVELTNAERTAYDAAHRGQAAEPPAETPAPLGSTELIQHHEQHFFTACRRLIFTLADAGLGLETSAKHFERLKNKISDEFRTLWCLNQGRSKEFCAATFDQVFAAFVEKYLGGSATDAAAAAATAAGDDAPPAPPVTAAASSKKLKQFYQGFMDLLDEYELKAIGTRRGDVMLYKTKDLLERVEQVCHSPTAAGGGGSGGEASAAAAGSGGGQRSAPFHLADFALAAADINTEVTKRVLGVTKEMDRSRGELQKTCALYTKLLGMQCRKRIAGSSLELYEAQRDHLSAAIYEKQLMFATVLSLASEPESAEALHPDQAAIAAALGRFIESTAAAEQAAEVEIAAFLASLPYKERSRYPRFGVVSEESVSATDAVRETTANVLRALQSKASETGGKLGTKAKWLASKMSGKLSSKGSHESS